MGAWAYYNDIEPFVTEWTKNLMRQGIIMDGEIDERPIEQVQPEDLKGFTRVHLFSGACGWELAFQLAGIPRERPLWSCSCPCPPFSIAGKGKQAKCPACQSEVLVWCPRRTGHAICASCGHAWVADARHLLPEAWRLVAHSRPERCYGEQVASDAAIDWIAGVQASLEILHYDSWVQDIAAASIGAPNIRQRLFWMADSYGEGPVSREQASEAARHGRPFEPNGYDHGLGEPSRVGREARVGRHGRRHEGSGEERGQQRPHHDGDRDGMGNAERTGLERHVWNEARRHEPGWLETEPDGPIAKAGIDLTAAWADIEWIPDIYGNIRPIKPGIEPLVDRLPGHMGQISAFGNAICPQAAAAFIIASEGRVT